MKKALVVGLNQYRDVNKIGVIMMYLQFANGSLETKAYVIA